MSRNFRDGCGLYIVALLIGLTVGPLLGGIVLEIAWDWFIVTTFEVTSISVLQAIGISIVASMLTGSGSRDMSDKDGVDMISIAISDAVFKPVFYLAFAWVIHIIMTG